LKYFFLMAFSACLLIGVNYGQTKSGNALDRNNLNLGSQGLNDNREIAPSSIVQATTTSLEMVINADEYRVFPGDQFRLEISRSVEPIIQLTVTPEGWLEIPLLKKWQVANRLLSDVRKEITQDIETLFPQSKVSLNLTQLAKYKVLVTGMVKRPGSYEIQNGIRVYQVIEQAGGFLPQADLWQVSIHHINGAKMTYNLKNFLTTGNKQMNPMLSPGDHIHVDVASLDKKHIMVFCDTLLNGYYYLQDSISVWNFLAENNFPVQDIDLRNIIVIRNGKSFSVDLSLVGCETFLQNGDLVNLSIIKQSVYVSGEVKNPGAFGYIPGSLMIDYVGKAGVLPTSADLSRCYIIDGKTGNKKLVDFDQLIYPGDQIVVPKSRGQLWREYIQTFAGVVSLIMSVVSLSLVTK